MRKIGRFFGLWMPVFLWAGLIFYFSSVPNLRATPNPKADEIIRSSLHCVFYAVFYCLTFRAINYQKKKANLFLPFILSALYAVSDEIHQYFVPTRACQLKDLLVDWAGITLGLIILWRLFINLPKKIIPVLGKLKII